jgi:xylulokinase
VDENGNALRNPMIYLDGRATKQIARHLYRGVLKIDKWNARKTLVSLAITGGLAGTAKDPLWKYHWVRDNEPELFKKTHRWLDVKDYLVFRCTGKFAMTYDSAHLTWVYNTRPGHLGWSRTLTKMFDVNPAHLPPVVRSTDVVGGLTDRAASEMGLAPGIPVFGGAETPRSSRSAQAASTCMTRTSMSEHRDGWSRMSTGGCGYRELYRIDPRGDTGEYIYAAEQETAGLCLQWFRDHLALDEIGVYLNASHVCDDPGSVYESLYHFLNEVVAETEPGAGNLLFTRGSTATGRPGRTRTRGDVLQHRALDRKRQMVRAVLEGGAFHVRWMLEAIERKIPAGRRCASSAAERSRPRGARSWRT